MEADLNTSTNFYFLNQNFEVIHKLTQYESLMWVDKYDEPGSFEIYAPPLKEIKESAQINNYFMSDKSNHLMIVEKLETTVTPTDGTRLIISGRSLESILDRRVLFMKCYFRDRHSQATPSTPEEIGADNLEDAVRQLLDYLFINPGYKENGVWQPLNDRKVDNFIFEYSHDEAINDIHLKDCEFEKGSNALDIVNTIVKQAGLGYQITLNDQNQFVFTLIKGKNRCLDQFVNPAVIFSPKFNNLKSSKFTLDSGENYKNFVYTEGETYKSRKPTIIETGSVTGLLRREIYIESEVQHETESSNVTHEGITKNKKKLTEEEYQAALKEDADKYFKKLELKTTLESEIEPRLTFQYGRDFGIGDILEVQDGTGNAGKIRCTEFIISHSASGYEEYPTFVNYTDPNEEEPAQYTGSGGAYTDGNSSGGGSSGGDYDLKMGAGKDTTTLTENGSDKTTLPLVAEFVGTRLEWNALSSTDKAKYRLVHFTDEQASVFSHVGQIIESTTLDTEAKVKAIYGSNTSWIRHTGYMLRGAASNVSANHSGNDGGADSVTVSSVANHNHTQNAHAHDLRQRLMNGQAGATSYGFPFQTNQSGTPYTIGGNVTNLLSAQGASVLNATATNVAKGADYTVNTLPKYKNVYIWERVS